jgi:phenylalanyl-tRNA synthetase alpha chain
MVAQKPPVRVIGPGAAYRRDEIDATHLNQFNQLEGLYVNSDVSVADLKGTLEYFVRELLGHQVQTRLRPHFFPFTEPSFELDIRSPGIQSGKWMELLGCGMVNPAVFEAINAKRGDNAYDPEAWTGFAFGMGLERLAMSLFGLPDIRLLIENDQRFLAQFAR